MNHVSQQDRHQIEFTSLDMQVSQNSTVRVIDAFLEFAMDYKLGFVQHVQRTGRPSFPIRTLLGIYMYGYLNRIRSSRELERTCHINLEVQWLIYGQKPCYKTIANFRKDNGEGFANLFKLFREFCKHLDLYGKETIAIDGSKFRAQNSKKNNFNAKKIERQLVYIEEKENEYLTKLDEEDRKEAMDNPQSHQRLAELSKRRLKYQHLKERLEESEDLQISAVDPDARALPQHMNIIEVGYNNQVAVDDKHYLYVDYDVTNKKDDNALSGMAKRSKESLGLKAEDSMRTLADKGYYKGAELQECHDNNIETLVAIRDNTKQHKRTEVTKDKFIYDTESDTYTCPQGNTLTRQATYTRRKAGKAINKFDRYTIKHSICSQCPLHEHCVGQSQRKASQGKFIDRSEYQEAIDKNAQDIAARPEEYKRRQAIVEHGFGTIKRSWGYTYTLMRTLPKVKTEFSIIFLCYNLRRVMSILGLEGMKMALKEVIFRILVLRTTTRAHDSKNLLCIHEPVYSAAA